MSDMRAAPGLCLFITICWLAVAASLRLTSYQELPRDGEQFTLTCDDDAAELLEVKWLRNSYYIFKTKSGQNMSIFETGMAAAQYQLVSDRVSMSATLKQHNVTLIIDSSLDDGTHWRCQINGTVSNELTINVFKTTTASYSSPRYTTVHVHDDSTSVTTSSKPITGWSDTTTYVPTDNGETTVETTLNTRTSTEPVSTSDNSGPNLVAIVAASVTVNVVLIALVVILFCVVVRRRRRRNKSQDAVTAESNTNVYSAMSRDSMTDNHYTDLKKSQLYQNSETTTTKDNAYYNTGEAEESGYENPPLSVHKASNAIFAP